MHRFLLVNCAARPGSGELRRLSIGVEPRFHATATKQLTAKAPGPRSKTGISTRVRAVVTAEPRVAIMPRMRAKRKFLVQLISVSGLAAPKASPVRGGIANLASASWSTASAAFDFVVIFACR